MGQLTPPPALSGLGLGKARSPVLHTNAAAGVDASADAQCSNGPARQGLTFLERMNMCAASRSPDKQTRKAPGPSAAHALQVNAGGGLSFLDLIKRRRIEE